ncbi:hypothetical protein EYF80_034836 [Liparis tanakae]|uniref:Uncharacterized protein n=1 Tax=Liparis tanakae TaxID=230148 RepID=A0A4Z2GMX2_9TELE|nr:hypothetical protein EYF80_034836 [Liparis tanakae]
MRILFHRTEPALTMADGLVCLSLSLRISFSMHSLMASLHARWQISVRSAPEKPLVIFANSVTLLMGLLRRLAFRMLILLFSSGSGM